MGAYAPGEWAVLGLITMSVLTADLAGPYRPRQGLRRTVASGLAKYLADQGAALAQGVFADQALLGGDFLE